MRDKFLVVDIKTIYYIITINAQYQLFKNNIEI